jgi:hypothetical protein
VNLFRDRARIAALALVLAALTVPLAAAPPAAAVHQYCGKDAIGVGPGYAGATSDNGHPVGPDVEPGGSWAGGAAVGQARRALFAFTQAEAVLAASTSVITEYTSNIAAAVVKLVKEIVAWVLRVGRVTSESVLLAREHANNEVNACNGVMMGDMVDAIFVAMLEEDLAYHDERATGSVPGARLAPAASFLFPDDGLPDWTPDGERYDDSASHPGHGDLAIQYPHGFLDAKYIGVATVVRNTIAYLKLHGIPTGDAEYRWAAAMDALRQGDLRNAYRGFADAYQTAVTAY